ncbi:MAG TPA: mechanosensitive ion channel [Deltaproteobacteria bacterium]|nr:mechanosensitive ion channel [Deltaproteobacteria bacterium]
MTLEDAWRMWLESPRIQASSVLLGSILFSVLVLALFRRMVRLAAHTETEVDDILVDGLRGPLATTILAGGGWYVLHLGGLPEVVRWGLGGVIITVAALHWGVALSAASGRMLDWVAQRQDQHELITPRTRPIFDIGAKTLVYAGAAYFILLAWDVDVTAWLASAGIIGVAIGFASQDTLSNLIAGVFILADAPYKLGDYLVLDNGDRGMVVEIGIRTTRLMTRDDVEIIVPNKLMANVRIINQSGGPEEAFRIRIAVGVAYGSDIDLVHRTLRQLADTTPGVRATPEPRIRFRAFGDSALEHDLLVWVETPADRGLVTHDILTRIYKRFGELGIEIPFPKRDVYLHQVDPGA